MNCFESVACIFSNLEIQNETKKCFEFCNHGSKEISSFIVILFYVIFDYLNFDIFEQN